MLRENDTKQAAGEHSKRWFADDDFDLIVWSDDLNVLSGFQLCYRLSGQERAISWNREDGLVFSRVDTGDQSAEKNRTPILVSDGIAPEGEVMTRFAMSSQEIDQETREFVMEKIREIPTL